MQENEENTENTQSTSTEAGAKDLETTVEAGDTPIDLDVIRTTAILDKDGEALPPIEMMDVFHLLKSIDIEAKSFTLMEYLKEKNETVMERYKAINKAVELGYIEKVGDNHFYKLTEAGKEAIKNI